MFQQHILTELNMFITRCEPNRTDYGENECHASCSEWCNPGYGCTAGTTCYNDLAFVEQLILNIMVCRQFFLNCEDLFNKSENIPRYFFSSSFDKGNVTCQKNLFL